MTVWEKNVFWQFKNKFQNFLFYFTQEEDGTPIQGVINHISGGGEINLRYRKNVKKPNLLNSPTRKMHQSASIKKSSVSNIIW